MKKDNLSLSNLTRRATSKTNSFWKKVQKIAGITGLIAGCVLTLPVATPIITIATVIASIAGTAVTVAQFTCADPQENTTI